MSRGARTSLIWLGLLGVVVVAVLYQVSRTGPMRQISVRDALDMVEAGSVDKYRLTNSGLVLELHTGERVSVSQPWSPVLSRLDIARIPRNVAQGDSDLGTLFVYLLILVGLIVLLVVVLRKAGGQYNTIFQLRKTKARPLQDSDKARFADIGGNQEAVELLGDVVDF